MQVAAWIRVAGLSVLIGHDSVAAAQGTVPTTGPSVARPTECTASRRHSTLGLWSRSGARIDAEFCGFVATGFAQLRESPERAIAVAVEAERRWPGRDAVRFLLARARVAAGQLEVGCRVLEQGGYLRSAVRLPPIETVLQARCAWRMGAMLTAQEGYRRVHVGEALLDSRSLLVRTLLEAAVLGMLVGGESLVEAQAYVARAIAARIEPGAMGIDDGILALALSRQGRDDEARAVAASSAGPWPLLEAIEARVAPTDDDAAADALLGLGQIAADGASGDPRQLAAPGAATSRFVAESEGFPVMAPVSELVAVAATLAQPFDGRLARQLWQRYAPLEGLAGPLREHAQRMLRVLAEGGVESGE